MNKALVQSVLPPPILAFKTKARAVTPRTAKVFDLSQAVPNYRTFGKIRQRVAEALSDEATDFYTDVPGLPALRQAVAETHPLLGADKASQVLITAGANHAMVTALLTLASAGDKVLLPEPYYFNYDMALPMLGLSPAYFPLSSADGLALNAKRMIEFLEGEQGRGVRVITLITPNNPTGARYEPAQIAELLAWTAPRGIEVVVDETYRRFDDEHLADERLKGFLGQGLSLVGSFSKSYSLTGYRVGYLVCSEAAFAQALKVQDTFVICAPHLGQVAALTGIRECENEVAEQVRRMRELGSTLSDACAPLRRWKLISTGAFFAYFKHSFDCGSEEAAIELYRNAGILGLPGNVFGKSQENFVRVSISNLEKPVLKEAIAQWIAWDATL